MFRQKISALAALLCMAIAGQAVIDQTIAQELSREQLLKLLEANATQVQAPVPATHAVTAPAAQPVAQPVATNPGGSNGPRAVFSEAQSGAIASDGD